MGKGRRGGWKREPIVCGRKFCQGCGIWRHVSDYRPTHYYYKGERIVTLGGRCDACRCEYRRKWRQRNFNKVGPLDRERARILRRLKGARPRYEDERGYTGQLPLEPYEPINGVHAARREQVDATRFFEWYDEWKRKYNERQSEGHGGWTSRQYVVSGEDLCKMAGFNAKRLRDARARGTISYSQAEAFLTLAGHPEPWRLLDEEMACADR